MNRPEDWISTRALNGLERIGAIRIEGERSKNWDNKSFWEIDWDIVTDSSRWEVHYGSCSHAPPATLPLHKQLTYIRNIGPGTAMEITMAAWLVAWGDEDPHHPFCEEWFGSTEMWALSREMNL